MKKVIYKLIDNKKITLFFVLLIVAAGIFGYIKSPKQESPDFSIPYAMVTTVYPGASQSDVDMQVTVPIQKKLSEIEGYETSSAYSTNSLSLIILELDFSSDKDKAFNELKEAMRDIQGEIPKECLEINVNTHITDTAGILISFSSSELGNEAMGLYAETAGKALLEVDGISSYEVIGSLNTSIAINVNSEAMKKTELSLSDIYDLVAAGNLDIPIGNISNDNGKIFVNYNGSYESITDIENLVIGYSQELNRVMHLEDIAEISQEVSVSNAYYTHNGQDSIILAASFDEGINIVPLEEKINEKLDDLDNEFPKDLEVSIIISQPSEVSDSLQDFARNLVIAVALVILVILLGMGFRNALVVSVSLPFSILIAFGVMYLIGIKIHQVSIAALILCLGMLVDNSIVVSDSIQGYIDLGIKKKKACMLGVKEVSGPVFASTITTIAAFVPFLLLNSIAGDYIKSLPQIVSISLAASYLTAMMIIPVMGFILFKKNEKNSKKKRGRIFTKLLKSGLKKKWIVAVVVVVLLAGSMLMAMNLDVVFFPAFSKNIVYVDIRNNSSDDLDGTKEIVNKIERLIEKEEVVTEYTSSAGGGLPRFNQIMFVYTKTPDIGQIMLRIDLQESDYKANEDYKIELQKKIEEMNLDAKITVKELMYAFPMDEDNKIRLIGNNLEDLKAYEQQVYEFLQNKDGIINVNKGNTDYVSEYNLDILSEKAARYGLAVPIVQNELSLAILGREAAIIRNGDKEIPVIVTGDGAKDKIGEVPLRTASGEYINASEIIELKEEITLSTIPRYNGEYTMTITADYDIDFDNAELLTEIKDSIEKMEFVGVKVEYDGENQLIKENFGQVGILGIVALIAVFIILMIQFKSFSMPLIIFITIPLSVIGSIAGLYLTGQALSFTALLGVVSLLGIVVNNAIILIDYIKREREKGIKTNKACLNASARRLRPILLSTITTVIGLIPLAVGNSQLFKPMAIALMSGLMVSTLLTLVVLPVFISAVYKNRDTKKKSTR